LNRGSSGICTTSPCRLTVKLSGRAQAPDQRRGCTMAFSARGAQPTPHGPPERLLEAVTTTVVQAVVSQSEDSSGAHLMRKQRSTASGCVSKLPATRQSARIDQTPIPRDFSQTAEIALTLVGSPRSFVRAAKEPAATFSGDGNGGIRVQTAPPMRPTAVIATTARLFTASNVQIERLRDE
jgi:hypothetical protein